jgi:hypothetical protein
METDGSEIMMGKKTRKMIQREITKTQDVETGQNPSQTSAFCNSQLHRKGKN